MAWVRLDDQFADSPKMEQAGPLAAWLHVAALCYAGRHLTDGLIPKARAGRLAAVPAPTKRIRALVDAGAWHEPGHGCDRCPTCPEGHYLIHDYLDYQPSKAEKDAEREREREKKRRQRAKGAANAGRDPDTGRFAERDTAGESPPMSPGDNHRDTPGESPMESRRESPGESPATRPVPTPTEEQTSSDTSPLAADPPDDDDQHQQAPDQASDPDARVGAALALLADRDLDARQQALGQPPVGDPPRWRDQAYNRRRDRDGATLALLAAQHPDATPDQLADLADPPPPPTANGHRPRPGADIDPGYQQAVRARAEADMAKHEAAMAHPVDPGAADRARALRESLLRPGGPA